LQLSQKALFLWTRRTVIVASHLSHRIIKISQKKLFKCLMDIVLKNFLINKQSHLIMDRFGNITPFEMDSLRKKLKEGNSLEDALFKEFRDAFVTVVFRYCNHLAGSFPIIGEAYFGCDVPKRNRGDNYHISTLRIKELVEKGVVNTWTNATILLPTYLQTHDTSYGGSRVLKLLEKQLLEKKG
jgi:hypothetical protein